MRMTDVSIMLILFCWFLQAFPASVFTNIKDFKTCWREERSDGGSDLEAGSGRDPAPQPYTASGSPMQCRASSRRVWIPARSSNEISENGEEVWLGLSCELWWDGLELSGGWSDSLQPPPHPKKKKKKWQRKKNSNANLKMEKISTIHFSIHWFYAHSEIQIFIENWKEKWAKQIKSFIFNNETNIPNNKIHNTTLQTCTHVHK